MKIGYTRISTQDQNFKIQSDQLKKFGCEKIFKEKISGKDKERPELEKMIGQLKKGDVVVISKLDRLANSLRDLIDLMTKFKDKGVSFVSLHDSINTATTTGKFAFNLFASLAEFEREIIRERTMVGLASARARGRTGGRRPGLTKESLSKASLAKKLFDAGTPANKIAEQLGIGRATVYRYIDIIKSAKDKSTVKTKRDKTKK